VNVYQESQRLRTLYQQVQDYCVPYVLTSPWGSSPSPMPSSPVPLFSPIVPLFSSPPLILSFVSPSIWSTYKTKYKVKQGIQGKMRGHHTSWTNRSTSPLTLDGL
jgi:hypothetical protein